MRLTQRQIWPSFCTRAPPFYLNRRPYATTSSEKLLFTRRTSKLHHVKCMNFSLSGVQNQSAKEGSKVQARGSRSRVLSSERISNDLQACGISGTKECISSRNDLANIVPCNFAVCKCIEKSYHSDSCQQQTAKDDPPIPLTSGISLSSCVLNCQDFCRPRYYPNLTWILHLLMCQYRRWKWSIFSGKLNDPYGKIKSTMLSRRYSMWVENIRKRSCDASANVHGMLPHDRFWT